MSTEVRPRLRLAHLYPNLMNLYGDRGNVYCLHGRCEARGIELEVDGLVLGDSFDPSRYDLVFIGGGQDREQWRVNDDLLTRKGPPLREAVEAGMPVLAVCGGYQMMGHYYQSADGARMPGLGIFDITTVHPGEEATRCIGNIVVRWSDGELVGFENHGGRTYPGKDARPLGRVVVGFGNNGSDRSEGCRRGNAIGTYLHGSLLPKNPALADVLIGTALQRKYGAGDLQPLDDRLEQNAHAAAAQIARRDALASGSGAVLRWQWRRLAARLRPRCLPTRP